MRPATPPGVSLGAYRANRADVLLTCLDCFWRQTIDRERLIARLEARRVGDERTGIKAVAQFVTRACPAAVGGGSTHARRFSDLQRSRRPNREAAFTDCVANRLKPGRNAAQGGAQRARPGWHGQERAFN